MIRTPDCNDVLQRQVLDTAFDLVLGEIQAVRTKDISKRDFNENYPISTKVLTLDQIENNVKRLKECTLDSKLWMLTDYHWLLLYEILDYQLDDYDFENLLDPVDGYIVVDIDKDAVLSNWFWDHDFLFEAKLVTPDIKEKMGINEEVFSIANRLKAHPDELILEQITDEPRTIVSVEDMIKEANEAHEEDEINDDNPLGNRKDGTIRLYEYVIVKKEAEGINKKVPTGGHKNDISSKQQS